MSVSHRRSSSEALCFVTATVQADVASMYLCVLVPCFLSTYTRNGNEHVIARGAIDWMQLSGQDDTNPYFLGISETTAQPRYTLEQQQRYSSSTTAPALHNLSLATAAVFLCSYIPGTRYVCALFTRRYMQNRDHVPRAIYNRTHVAKPDPVIQYAAVLVVNRDA